MDIQKLLEFLPHLAQLKHLKRSGWKRFNIPDIESVADHSFGITLLAYILADQLPVNKEKLITMALIHDLPEAMTGDITPHDEDYKNKHQAEKEAMEKLNGLVEYQDMVDVWQEMEAGLSPEAKIVHELDKLEMVAQALAYEKETGTDLTEFWDHAGPYITNPTLRTIFKALQKQRPAP